jgi:hypothetical protein
MRLIYIIKQGVSAVSPYINVLVCSSFLVTKFFVSIVILSAICVGVLMRVIQAE